jgi:hypothetical protein
MSRLYRDSRADLTIACVASRRIERALGRHGWAALVSVVPIVACAGDPAAVESAPPAYGLEAGPGGQSPATSGSQPPATGMQLPSDAGSDAARPVTLPEAGLPPTSELDPGVAFDWPETKPGSGRRCQGGSYTGTWMCSAFGLVPFNGDVELQFVESMDGEFLDLADGRLYGLVGEGEWRFDGKLIGRLDCTTLKFSAEISTGNYDSLDPFTNTYQPFGSFGGTLTGALELAAQQIEGEWSLTSDSLVNCTGPWTADFTP